MPVSDNISGKSQPPPLHRWFRQLFNFSCLTTLLLGLIPSPIGAAEKQNILSLLPAEEAVAPWSSAYEPLRYEARDLFNFINGGAEVYLEYGFVQVVSQEYIREEDSTICTIYEMTDPQAAFGIFSYNRNPRKPSLTLGDGGYGGELQIAFWQDRYFSLVESFSSDEETGKTLLSFAEKISRSIGSHAAEPAVLNRLPRQGLVKGSIKLLRGRLAADSLFFLEGADPFQLNREDLVLFGEYEGSSEKMKLFMVIYGSAGKASRVHPGLQQAFNSENGYHATSEQSSNTWIKDDRYFGLVQEEDSLLLVTEATSLEEVRLLLEQAGES